MVIHKCDVCGKEMCAWLEITPQPNTSNSILNIANLLQFRTTHEICDNCWNNILMQFDKKT
jgi:hypothetical protein